MVIPPVISYHNMEPSAAIDAAIREKAAKLDRFYDHIMSCRIAVESRHQQHRKGNLYHVRLDITVPGGELVVSRDPEKNHAHEDIYVAIRDAFKAATRQLEEYGSKQRGDVKAHDVPPHGRISVLVPEEDFGRIETADGRSIYFHRNSVLDTDFDDLRVGDEVRFAEERGEEGPQASTVQVIGKHHITG